MTETIKPSAIHHKACELLAIRVVVEIPKVLFGPYHFEKLRLIRASFYQQCPNYVLERILSQKTICETTYVTVRATPRLKRASKPRLPLWWPVVTSPSGHTVYGFLTPETNPLKEIDR